MTIAVRTERDGDRARLVPVGAFDVAHAPAVAQAVAQVPPDLEGCRSIDLDLTHLDRIDGSGAVLLARFLDRLDFDGDRTRIVADRNPEAARLITLHNLTFMALLMEQIRGAVAAGELSAYAEKVLRAEAPVL